MAVKGTNSTIPNNVGASEGPPRKEFYLREKETDPLFGPLSYRDANKYARDASRDNETGLMEMLVFVGSRPSDPKGAPHLRVVAKYVRGRLITGGK